MDVAILLRSSGGKPIKGQAAGETSVAVHSYSMTRAACWSL